MNNKKIALIGCGNLGLSILNGLIENDTIPNTQITATKRKIDTLKHLNNTGITISTDNIQAVKDSNIIILALKPYTILDVVSSIAPYLKPQKHILVSLASGVSLPQLKETISQEIPLFRAMPNTAADVRMSMTCISTDSANSESIENVITCFNSIGKTIIINEDLMDSATVLGACGIAFALRFIRGMMQGGIQIGFDAKTANEIVTQTVKGAAELLIQREEHPEYEIDKVTTPKGCTIAGLNEMEHNGFSSSLIKGITTSFDEI